MSELQRLAEHIAATSTVTIVTTSSRGKQIATPIWAVAVDGVPYVRSAYGETAVWHRRARSGRPAWFTLADGARAEADPVAALDDPRVAVEFTHLAFDDPQQEGVDVAFQAKYGHTPHIGAVTSDDARNLTLRVEPV